MNGKIVIIEGVEGVGKSTLIGELKKIYTGRGRDIKIWKFPDISHLYGEEIYEMLNDSSKYNPLAFQIGVTAQIMRELSSIKKAKEDGYIVLIERCFLSVMAYGYVEGIPESIIKSIGNDINKFIDYDVMILLALRPDSVPFDVEKCDRYKGKSDVLQIINSFMRGFIKDFKAYKIMVDGSKSIVGLGKLAFVYIDVGDINNMR